MGFHPWNKGHISAGTPLNNGHIESKGNVNMETLVSVLGYLATLGFDTQFKATAKGLLSLTTHRTFQSSEVRVVHFYRFEGESSPDDSAILYAIETTDKEKGTLVDGYGISGDSQVTDFVQQIEEIHK
jgi:hypothetical protein